MKKKKEVKEKKWVEVATFNHCSHDCVQIPVGATHVECEMDYSDCYYESDIPCVKMTFMKLVD